MLYKNLSLIFYNYLYFIVEIFLIIHYQSSSFIIHIHDIIQHSYNIVCWGKVLSRNISRKKGTYITHTFIYHESILKIKFLSFTKQGSGSFPPLIYHWVGIPIYCSSYTMRTSRANIIKNFHQSGT